MEPIPTPTPVVDSPSAPRATAIPPLPEAELGDTQPLLDIRNVTVHLGFGSARTRILDSVSLAVRRGHTLGLVGESGSGKSTLARTLVGEISASSGEISFAGRDIRNPSRPQLRKLRRAVQLIPQDPYSSLNPRRTIGQALAEAIDPIHGTVRRHRADIGEWLERVALPADAAERYPHEFSGGQRQRIAIARALAVKPQLIIADEITSALDLTTQAEILNLLADLRRDVDMTMLFISHNLAVVRHVSDEVAVLFRGDLVEFGHADQVYNEPAHDYTRRLMASVPGGLGFNIDVEN